MTKNIFIIMGSLALLAGCQSKAANGALIGGGVGTGVGALVSHNVGGAALGAGLGALTGAVVGDSMERYDNCPCR